ncbi:MAG: hypothetical protein MZU97_12800 [Bacillus subtilis]|nr:hypothetical protein [Bacillus subtilis]
MSRGRIPLDVRGCDQPGDRRLSSQASMKIPVRVHADGDCRFQAFWRETGIKQNGIRENGFRFGRCRLI